MIFSFAMIIGAGSLQLYNISDNKRIENETADITEQLEEIYDGYIANPNSERKEKVEIKGNTYVGELIIPSLNNLTLPIIDTFSYQNLKVSICRYSGGIGKSKMIICGHNYKSSFGKLNNLKVGSIVYLKKLDGTVYKYRCKDITTIEPTEIEEMQTGEWDLTLFTCTYGGQKRLTLRFEIENKIA